MTNEEYIQRLLGEKEGAHFLMRIKETIEFKMKTGWLPPKFTRDVIFRLVTERLGETHDRRTIRRVSDEVEDIYKDHIFDVPVVSDAERKRLRLLRESL
jgi:hypothetical protein